MHSNSFLIKKNDIKCFKILKKVLHKYKIIGYKSAFFFFSSESINTSIILFCKTFTINLLSPTVFYLVIWWYQAQCYFQEEAGVFLLGIEPGSLVNYQTKVRQTFYLADILWSGYYHQDLQYKPKKREI